MSGKGSFVLHLELSATLEKLSDEQCGSLLRSMFRFHLGEPLGELDPIVDIALTPLLGQFRRDKEKWELTKQERVNAGRLGGVAKASKAKQSLAKPSKQKQSLANLAVNVNVDVDGNVDGSVEEKETTKEKEIERIYEAYPRKSGRGYAVKCIEKALEKVAANDLLAAVEEYAAATAKWPDKEKAYIPHPSTWFNQERWKDDRATWRKDSAKGGAYIDPNEYPHGKWPNLTTSITAMSIREQLHAGVPDHELL